MSETLTIRCQVRTWAYIADTENNEVLINARRTEQSAKRTPLALEKRGKLTCSRFSFMVRRRHWYENNSQSKWGEVACSVSYVLPARSGYSSLVLVATFVDWKYCRKAINSRLAIGLREFSSAELGSGMTCVNTKPFSSCGKLRICQRQK
jgi:vacuolar-type H+-ATPase subunit C/Vma6